MTNLHFFAFVVSTLVVTSSANNVGIENSFQSAGLALTDDTIHEAVRLWNKGGSYKESAQVLYGLEIGQWNTSMVTNMAGLFRNQEDFQEDIRGWDISRVTTLKEAFYGASSFNYDLSAWTVAQVTDFGGMFIDASSLGVSLCWRSIDWTAFVKDIFCGTASASFDPCCVDEIIVMASCCGNENCGTFCNHQVTPPNLDVDENDAAEQSMQGNALSGPEEDPNNQSNQGNEANQVNSENDGDTVDNTNTEHDNEDTNEETEDTNEETGSSAPTTATNMDDEDVVNPTSVVTVNSTTQTNDEPNEDALVTDQKSSSSANTSANSSNNENKGRSKRKLIIGFILGASLTLALLWVAAMLVYRRLEHTDMILDPESTTMAGKQVPTADEEEENDEEQATTPSIHDQNNDTFADTDAPTHADDDATLGTLPTIGSIPKVQQYYFFSSNQDKDIVATTESCPEETFNPFLQFTSLGGGSTVDYSFGTSVAEAKKNLGADMSLAARGDDEESGIPSVVQSTSLGGGNVDDESVTVNFPKATNLRLE